jgi:hypothetical protein
MVVVVVGNPPPPPPPRIPPCLQSRTFIPVTCCSYNMKKIVEEKNAKNIVHRFYYFTN